jgi:hypothetical protein
LSIDRLNGNVQRDGTTLERGETFFGEIDEIVIRNDWTGVIQAGAIRGKCLDDAFIDVLYRDCHTWNDSPRRIGDRTANITGVRVLRK